MGKKLFLFAAAAVALASCTETDLSGDTSLAKESTSDAIQFSAKAGNSGVTRATGGKTGNMTTTVLKDANAGFGVFAFYNTEGAAITHNAENAFGAAISESINPNFMYNQKVTWTDPNWVYAPVKYWPNEFANGNVDNQDGTGEDAKAQGAGTKGNVSFFAYAPYVDVTASTGGTSNDDGITALTANNAVKDPLVTYKFKTSSAMDDQNVDLLWGLSSKASYSQADGGTQTSGIGTAYNVNLNKMNVSDKIGFLFKHALARVGGSKVADVAKTGMKIKLDVDGNNDDNQTDYFGYGYNAGTNNENRTLVTVEKITIQDKLDGDNKSTLYTQGQFDIANGKWKNGVPADKTGAANAHYIDLTYPTNGAFNPQIVEPAASKLEWDGTNKVWKNDGATTTGVTVAAQDVFKNDVDANAFYLIPSGDDQKLVVSVTYTVRTYDANLAASGDTKAKTAADATWTVVKQTITNEVTIPSTVIKPNKHVALLIHLGLTSVKFEAIVSGWSNETEEANPGEPIEEQVWLPSNTLETVSSFSIAAGTPASTAAIKVVKTANDSFTLTVTGLDSSESYKAVSSDTDAATVSDGTATSEGNASVTVNIKENSTTSPRDFTITVRGETSSKSTVVSFRQAGS